MRSRRFGQEEFHRMPDGVAIDDTELPNDKLKQREDCYNHNRPHGSLGGQTPCQRLKQKTNRL